MRNLILTGLLLVGGGCFPLESILIDDGSATTDTVVVHDTTIVICRHHDPRPECRRDHW
jgi:hypothetical protein